MPHVLALAMYNVTAQRQIARKELKEGLEGARSWHHQYKDSAYVYIGGLHEGLTEGPVLVWSDGNQRVKYRSTEQILQGFPLGHEVL